MPSPIDYDRVAPAYDARYSTSAFYAPVEATLLRMLGSDRAQRIVEVGCGTGHWIARLMENGFDAEGHDASPRMLEVARQKLPSARFTLGTADALPYTAATVDFLFSVNALHHFADPAAYFREAGRVLRPGGRLVTIGMDPHARRDEWFVYDFFPETREIDRARFSPASRLREWLADAGFIECDTVAARHEALWVRAEDLIAAGLVERGATSQLGLLSDEQYSRGRRTLEAAVARAKASGDDLMLVVDVSLYATVGAKP